MHVRTAFGLVALKVWRGKDLGDGHWGCPIREHWGLSAHQQLSPALEARLEQPPAEKEPTRAPPALAVLMLDGFQVRFRGPGWGRRRTQQSRVEWHEMKLGVFYRHEHAVRGKRGQLAEKVLVGWQGEGMESGRRGFGTWWPTVGLGHTSCWTSIMPANLCGHWAKRCIRRTNRSAGSGWKAAGIACGTDRRRGGWPIGSGAVESGCRTRQCRRKRPGQFWTKAGLRHLDALEEARDNGHWDQLWLTA